MRDSRVATDRLLVARSALAGVGAYAGAYLLTYATVLVAASGVFVDRAAPWKVAGWYLHAAHGGRLAERSIGDARTGTATYDLLATTEGGASLLLVLPVLSTVLAGFLLVWLTGTAGVRRGTLLGTLLAVGYPIGTLVVAAATVQVTGDTIVALEYRPHLTPVVVLASVGYPAAFGGLGGAVAGWLDRRLTG